MELWSSDGEEEDGDRCDTKKQGRDLAKCVQQIPWRCEFSRPGLGGLIEKFLLDPQIQIAEHEHREEGEEAQNGKSEQPAMCSFFQGIRKIGL